VLDMSQASVSAWSENYHQASGREKAAALAQ